MSLPRSSQCCRAVHRRLRSPCDLISTPESSLATALEQCCSISGIAGRRDASHVPGPLENRKRLGKRHMGELNLNQTHPSAPLWELADAVDLTQWKWTPPTSFEARRTFNGEGRPQTFLEQLRAWIFPQTLQGQAALHDGAAGVPGSWTDLMEAVAEAEAVEPAHETPVRPRDLASQGILQRLPSNAKELKSACLDSLDQDRLRYKTQEGSANFAQFCDKLNLAVAEAQISPRHLHDFLFRITEALKKPTEPNSTHSDALLLKIYASVLDGLSLGRTTGISYFERYERVYRTLLHKAAFLSCSTHSLFQKILEGIPWGLEYKFQESFQEALVVYVTRFLRTWTPVQDRSSTKEDQQIIEMASCLRHLDSARQSDRNLIQEVTKFVTSTDRNRHIRYCWLQLLVRLPLVHDDFITLQWEQLELNVSIKTKKFSARVLTERELCTVFLAWACRGHQNEGSLAVYHDLQTKPECYDILSSWLWTTGRQRYVHLLAILLQNQGRDEELAHLVHGLRRSGIDSAAKPLAHLALGAGDPELALWVYIRCHQSQQLSRSFWKTSYAAEVLSTMINDPNINPGKVLDVFGIHPALPQICQDPDAIGATPTQEGNPVSQRSYRRILSRDELRRVGMVAGAIAQSPRFTESAALNHITRCVNYIQSYGQPLPRSVLLAVLNVVTRELAAGTGPGRASRLRWFLTLLLKQSSEAEVLRVGLSLNSWRGRLLAEKKMQEEILMDAYRRGMHLP